MISTLSTTDLLSLNIYRPDYFVAEREVAFFLSKCVKAKCKKITPLTDNLKHRQPQAVEAACTYPVSILTGPAGTGKTTTLKQIVNSFIAAGLRGIIVGPTGKAAVRADAVVNQDRPFTQKIKCSTVHSALQWSMMERSFAYNRNRRWPYDYVIFEEFSMYDIEIMRDGLEAICPGRMRIVFCGDQYQLPSVGPGNVSRDLIECGRIPATELDVVLRTGENSGITYNANLILKGQEIQKVDPSSGKEFKDFFMVGKSKEQDTVDAILRWVATEIPAKRNIKSDDIQVIAAGKDGLSGVKNLNRVLREELNRNTTPAFHGFKLGDKVINIRNLKPLNIVNGSVGFVRDTVHGDTGSHIVIDFGPGCGPNVNGLVDFKTTETIELAFALTVHKCQGSEFPVVITPLHRAHMRLMTRPLIYTDITRAQLMAIAIGDYEVLRHAIRNVSDMKRRTNLVRLLQLAIPENKAA